MHLCSQFLGIICKANAKWRISRADYSDSRGVAAIEFAIVSTVLTLMMIAAVDIGSNIYLRMRIQNAAQAGIRYAIAHDFDAAGISAAVANSTGIAGISALPAPTKFCGCPSNTGIMSTSCTATCSGGAAAGTYVQVSAQALFSPIIPYAGLWDTTVLTAQGMVRIR